MLQQEEIEDGEILSDGDDVPENKSEKKLFETYSLIERPDRSQFLPGKSGAYRSASGPAIQYSSEDEDQSDVSDDDDDDDSPIKKKQQRMGHAPVNKQTVGGYKQDRNWIKNTHQNIIKNASKGKKRNNIWGSVLEEEKMASFVSQLNRNEDINYTSRGAESYDYTRSSLDPRLENASESSSSESEEEVDCPADLTIKETFGFAVDKKPSVKSRLGSRANSTNSTNCSSRSRSVSVEKEVVVDDAAMDNSMDNQPTKNRHKYRNKKKNSPNNTKNSPDSMDTNHKRQHGFDARQKIKGKVTNSKDNEENQVKDDLRGNIRRKRKAEKKARNRKRKNQQFELKPMKLCVNVAIQMEEMELVDTILDALREPAEKMDLFMRIVDVLGAEKAIKIFKATEDIEEMGGLLIQNGSRRRTPGGVFLYLVRNDCDVTKDQMDKMFIEEQENKERKQKEEIKAEEATNEITMDIVDKHAKAAMETDNNTPNSEDKIEELLDDDEAINIELS